jgi:hypothetical protein
MTYVVASSAGCPARFSDLFSPVRRKEILRGSYRSPIGSTEPHENGRYFELRSRPCNQPRGSDHSSTRKPRLNDLGARSTTSELTNVVADRFEPAENPLVPTN